MFDQLFEDGSPEDSEDSIGFVRVCPFGSGLQCTVHRKRSPRHDCVSMIRLIVTLHTLINFDKVYLKFRCSTNFSRTARRKILRTASDSSESVRSALHFSSRCTESGVLGTTA